MLNLIHYKYFKYYKYYKFIGTTVTNWNHYLSAGSFFSWRAGLTPNFKENINSNCLEEGRGTGYRQIGGNITTQINVCVCMSPSASPATQQQVPCLPRSHATASFRATHRSVSATPATQMHPDCHKVPWKKQLRHHTDQGAPRKCALTATKCQACRTKQPQRDTDQGAPPQPVKCQCHQVPHLPRKSTAPMSRSATHVRQSTTELWQSRVCVLRSCAWHCVTKLRLTMLRVCVWHICIDVKLLLFK